MGSVAPPAAFQHPVPVGGKPLSEMPEPLSWDEAQAGAIVAAHASMEGAALPMLHALQEAFGCIPDRALPLVASALNLSRAEVHGIVSFYHDFRREPAGRHVLKLCRAEACQSMGGARIAETLLAELGIGWGGTTADRALTVEPVFCLGLCACAPAALYDGEPRARLDAGALSLLAREARAS